MKLAIFGGHWEGEVVLGSRLCQERGIRKRVDSGSPIRIIWEKDGLNCYDIMTGDCLGLPYCIPASASRRIISEFRGTNRILYGVSSKPSSTIEWE